MAGGAGQAGSGSLTRLCGRAKAGPGRCGGMVDAGDSKSPDGNIVRVRVSPPAPDILAQPRERHRSALGWLRRGGDEQPEVPDLAEAARDCHNIAPYPPVIRRFGWFCGQNVANPSSRSRLVPVCEPEPGAICGIPVAPRPGLTSSGLSPDRKLPLTEVRTSQGGIRAKVAFGVLPEGIFHGLSANL